MATIIQTPGEYNLGFGINPVTLSGITNVQDKYVLQIRNRLGTTTWADVRQAPNAQGRALFDIQQILQNLLNPSPVGIETATRWVPGTNELDEYRIYYGTETAGVATIDGFIGGLKVLSGRKEPADLLWPGQVDYRYTTSQTGLCTNVTDRGDLLTDWRRIETAQSTGFSIPPRISNSMPILHQELRTTDAYTVSFLQDPLKSGAVTANNILGAWVTSYNSAGVLLDDVFIYNITPAGGGPDTTPLQNLAVVDPYWSLTLPCGPAAGIVASNLPQLGQAAYYWVTLHTSTGPLCGNGGLVWNTTTSQWQLQPAVWNAANAPVSNVAIPPAFMPLLVEIIPGECNDFEPIQLSWENSFGFRDYWTFAKRHDREIGIQRNDYLQGLIDYNGTTVNPSAGGRGYRTFSQQLTNKYTVRTNWLNDAEAAYLENLFISPDVRANLGNGFVSVTLLTTNYVERTIRKDRMFQYELQFKTAYNIKSQRG